MKKILITGISCFAGSFLAERLLKEKDVKIFGTILKNTQSLNISHIQDKLHLYALDLLDTNVVSSMISETMPDEIYHLAALTAPSLSFSKPAETISNNVTAQVNIFESIRKIENYLPRVLITSSADVYGIVEKKYLPINENTPLRPANPYAVSKIAQDYLALQYYLSYKIPIIRVRPFNHIGPRQALHFVVSDFSKRIVDIEKGILAPVIKVGNLHAKRDFTDVRDMVYAYSLLMEKGESGQVYNIGSGTSRSIEDILHQLLLMSKKKISIQMDKSLIRPSDNPELICDAKKITDLTGWKPKIPFEKTLRDTLDYWRDIG
jgi:GDP-4-dehydro-6-deoxy-D-mannose reductase